MQEKKQKYKKCEHVTSSRHVCWCLCLWVAFFPTEKAVEEQSKMVFVGLSEMLLLL
jgi:hypothetical protein